MKNPLITERQLKIIFTNMRVYRNLLNLNQEEFGKMVGMKQSEYSKLESGQIENWAKYWDNIANALGINPFQLFIEEPEVSLKNKKLVINGLDKDEYEKSNTSFYLHQLLNAKQERQMKEDRKELIKITRKWKSVESRLFKAQKENSEKDNIIQKMKIELESFITLNKSRINSDE